MAADRLNELALKEEDCKMYSRIHHIGLYSAETWTGLKGWKLLKYGFRGGWKEQLGRKVTNAEVLQRLHGTVVF